MERGFYERKKKMTINPQQRVRATDGRYNIIKMHDAQTQQVSAVFLCQQPPVLPVFLPLFVVVLLRTRRRSSQTVVYYYLLLYIQNWFFDPVTCACAYKRTHTMSRLHRAVVILIRTSIYTVTRIFLLQV